MNILTLNFSGNISERSTNLERSLWGRRCKTQTSASGLSIKPRSLSTFRTRVRVGGGGSRIEMSPNQVLTWDVWGPLGTHAFLSSNSWFLVLSPLGFRLNIQVETFPSLFFQTQFPLKTLPWENTALEQDQSCAPHHTLAVGVEEPLLTQFYFSVLSGSWPNRSSLFP